jgi:hypothetical protein
MFPVFDTSRLKILPLAKRKHDLDLSVVLPLHEKIVTHKNFIDVSQKIIRARKNNCAVILMMGAHVLRSGVQNYLIDLMENGYISCIATNGASVIHDFEFALIGQTTESVSQYIKNGQFGLWKETGKINDIVKQSYQNGLGLGESIGKAIDEENFPYKNISVFASAYRLNIPLTVHVGIGYDIVHEHPNCDGAAYGATSYTDFLRFAKVLESLEGGVVMNFGSAVMGPEVYLKALSMVRNVAEQKNREIRQFATLVCDLHPLPEKFHDEAPKNSAGYYFRPWKTMLVRTVADGGKSYYVQGEHKDTIPELWTAINKIRDTE